MDQMNLCDMCVILRTTAGKYSYDEGSQFGILALHQLMSQMPLLKDCRKQVCNRLLLSVKVSPCGLCIVYFPLRKAKLFLKYFSFYFVYLFACFSLQFCLITVIS